MEWSGGQSMTQYLTNRSGQVTNVAPVRKMSVQVLSAIKYLHEQKLIHGNLRLLNTTINPETHKMVLVDVGVKDVIDFKKSKESQKEKMLNKIRKCSPEELEGRIGPKTDIWAFGCWLLQICTGMVPYEGIEDAEEIYDLLVNDKLTPLDYAL
jgi:serine/threonine protein kinase